MSKEIISILLPTRGRTEVLRKSLLSLTQKATHPERIEILFGIDEDDNDVLEYIKNVVSKDLKQLGIESRASIFKPLGYENLHIYVNTLAGNANGEWLFFWNDDCLMETKGWDTVIDQYNG